MARSRAAGVALAVFLMAGLLLPGTAAAQTTYEIQVGQDFFEMGVPGFSSRPYPQSVTVHRGDVLHVTTPLALFPGDQYPQEFWGVNMDVDDPHFLLWSDEDEGADALKWNFPDANDPCGASAATACEWNGSNEGVLFPTLAEQGDIYVTITANPGSVLWASTAILTTEVGTNLKVTVVPENEAASTQAELDARAERLMAKDREDALALHARMGAKQTSHTNAAGQKVFDVWVGASTGPVEMLASYPVRTRIPQGGRVQFHFTYENEIHTATFGGTEAREVMQTEAFVPVCDPDGDQGTSPDTEPTFDDQGNASCPEGSSFELDTSRRAIDEVGDGRVTGNSDYENSGLKLPVFPDGGALDNYPWTIRFPKTSPDKGFRFICLIHGGFMGGRVIVR